MDKNNPKTGKHAGMSRGFHVLHKASYKSIITKPEIMIGFYNDGTTGEFAIRWHDFGDNGNNARLEVFDDSWETLAYFDDLLAELAKLSGTSPTPDEIEGLLKRLGMKDLTQYGG